MKSDFENNSHAKERMLGWIGFSTVAHVSLLIAILLSRSVHRQSSRPEKRPQPSSVTLEVSTVSKSLNREVVVTAEKPAVKDDVVFMRPKPATRQAKRVAASKKARAKNHPPAKLLEVAKKELPLKSYQPESVPSTATAEEISREPEMLSPVISDPVDNPEQAANEPPANTDANQEQDTQAMPAEETATPETEGQTGAQQIAPEEPGAIVDASLRQPLNGNPLPTYPQRDRLLGKQGTATVIARVGSNGQVSEVQVERSSGSSSIDQASIDAFKSWRFAPGPTATVRKSFAFNLQGEARVMHARLGSGS